MKNMFGKPRGSFADLSPQSRMSFTPTTAKSLLTFMPLKSHSALATWSSKEASNSQRRMFFILGEPMEFGELQVTLLDDPLLAELGRRRSFLASHWSLVCAMCFFFHCLSLLAVWLVYLDI